ncbi:hypothetical protein MJO28_016512 [Puccinia striiformis f. sp. tritici]|uniref:Uncharacterized protein n=1 Tax=Puccinia striiformis f. sp. tritici TaxID=168172 RepID=A0ACC0DNR1_9BASI|nr:hypothetical protein MJO28_016512 [Puccinia striiformis f. sp. tritici]
MTLSNGIKTLGMRFANNDGTKMFFLEAWESSLLLSTTRIGTGRRPDIVLSIHLSMVASPPQLDL